MKCAVLPIALSLSSKFPATEDKQLNIFGATSGQEDGGRPATMTGPQLNRSPTHASIGTVALSGHGRIDSIESLSLSIR